MYYLVDNNSVDIDDIEFRKNGKPCFDYIESSDDLDELKEMRANIVYNEACDYVIDELDFEPGTNQFDENVMFEAEDHFSIIDSQGNVLEE